MEIKRVRVPCVYNSPPWGIRKLTINELTTLWYVPLLLQEKLEELDKESLLVQFLSLVPGNMLFLAIYYLISLRIWGGLVPLRVESRQAESDRRQIIYT